MSRTQQARSKVRGYSSPVCIYEDTMVRLPVGKLALLAEGDRGRTGTLS